MFTVTGAVLGYIASSPDIKAWKIIDSELVSFTYKGMPRVLYIKENEGIAQLACGGISITIHGLDEGEIIATVVDMLELRLVGKSQS
jgi:hypothetical protein